MAKRTRKQKERAVARRPGSSGTAGAPTGGVSFVDADRPVSAAAAPAVPAAPGVRRRVERVATAGVAAPLVRRPQKGQPSGFIQPLESDDAAIPFDRVPYVRADLRRVAIIATVMIMLIILADIIVSNVVK